MKRLLHQACLTYVNNRITSLEATIKAVQLSANEETKSTAGDKYETGRAMAQLEIEKYTLQLAEVNKMKQDLSRISTEPTQTIKSGSLVFTTRGNFYIAINAGEISLDNQIFFTVSPASPIALKMNGLIEKSSFSLNNRDFTILEIR